MPVIELRQYTLHPGRRDELIDLFEREFVESQEDVGITLIGQFRDLDDPERFVWLRGFPDMAARQRSLQAFYFGPVWQAHREEANATMIDSDNVLLLRPLDQGYAFTPGKRKPVGAAGPGPGRVVGGVHALRGHDDPLPRKFVHETIPALRKTGAGSIATLVTDTSPNDFPRLPLREGEHVLVWFAAFADAAQGLIPEQSIQRLRLEPTARSNLHG